MQGTEETKIALENEGERKVEREHVVRWHFVGNKQEHSCTVNCHQLNGRQWGTPKKCCAPSSAIKIYVNYTQSSP